MVFVESEVDVMTDPVFGTTEMALLGRNRRTNQNEEVRLKNKATFITKRDEEPIENDGLNSQSFLICPYCKEAHEIENCETRKANEH